MLAEQIIEKTLSKEGGYSNNPSDAGGETMWGITIATARASGYTGPMRDMPRSVAVGIYKRNYFLKPGFDAVLNISSYITSKLYDIGVNMGPSQAVVFLQVGLNVLNQQGRQYQDVTVSGIIDSRTLQALKAYLTRRGAEGENILAEVIRCQQGARYIELAVGRVQNEDFIYSWFKNRVMGV